ncbi:MAG: DUF359 domain-containing protein [Euryarchaeota archaeon]|nr:DUF359 domain-containing protein [Euryarchaeota archaeon]
METIKVPDSLRSMFREPFGQLLEGEGLEPARKVKELLKGEPVIAVGDVTLRNLLEVGVRPSLAIVDLKTKREALEACDLGERVVTARNPPGEISAELQERIHEAIAEEGTVIQVDGEEDLAVLPCILEADWDSVVLYGQPDRGMVFVRVDEESKMKAATIYRSLLSL